MTSPAQPSSLSDIVDLASDRFASLVDQALDSLREIVDAGRSLVGCAESALLVPDENPAQLKFLVSANSREGIADIVTQVTVPIDSSLVGCVFNTGQMIAVANPDDYYDRVDRQTGLKTVFYLAVPIMNAVGDVLGVATFVNRLKGQPQEPFDEKEIVSATQLADLTASGLRYFQRIAIQQRMFQQELMSVANLTVKNGKWSPMANGLEALDDEKMSFADAIGSLEQLSQRDLELAAQLLGVLVSRSDEE